MYKNPCRLKAGIFVLCLQGELKAAIHGNLWEIRKNDFIGIMPGSVIQYYQQSADLRICFVAFSSSVMESINFQQLTIDFVSVMQENPVLSLEEKTATWFKDYFHFTCPGKRFGKGQFTSGNCKKYITISFVWSRFFIYKSFVE